MNIFDDTLLASMKLDKKLCELNNDIFIKSCGKYLSDGERFMHINTITFTLEECSSIDHIYFITNYGTVISRIPIYGVDLGNNLHVSFMSGSSQLIRQGRTYISDEHLGAVNDLFKCHINNGRSVIFCKNYINEYNTFMCNIIDYFQSSYTNDTYNYMQTMKSCKETKDFLENIINKVTIMRNKIAEDQERVKRHVNELENEKVEFNDQMIKWKNDIDERMKQTNYEQENNESNNKILNSSSQTSEESSNKIKNKSDLLASKMQAYETAKQTLEYDKLQTDADLKDIIKTHDELLKKLTELKKQETQIHDEDMTIQKCYDIFHKKKEKFESDKLKFIKFMETV
jgi:hypothetical protein